MLAVDLSSVAGLIEYGPSRMVAELVRMRPDMLFATAAEADALDVPLGTLTDHAVVKFGAAGCQVGLRRITAPAVEVFDPTGAGDALAAAFCAAILRGASEVEAAESAVMVASEAVGLVGARPRRRERRVQP
jgi:sugar/nucleoside kinase (ribokinase family)